MSRSESEQTSGRRGAIQLLGQLRSRQMKVSEVTVPERRVCVAYLRYEGYTQEEMCEVFQVHRRTIARDEAANRKEAAKLVLDLDARAVAGGLIGWARHLTAKAMKEKDHALVWRIQRELVQDLQSLGYLPKAVEQHQVQLATFLDLARLAAERRPASQVPEAAQAKALPAPSDPCQEHAPGADGPLAQCDSAAPEDDHEASAAPRREKAPTGTAEAGEVG